ncbi:MAG: hypothetical protein SWJ54_14185 [Cyanobacteriota bacterium]|nr:hypothetical protein [Cyanobacteriota bacterium]
MVNGKILKRFSNSLNVPALVTGIAENEFHLYEVVLSEPDD